MYLYIKCIFSMENNKDRIVDYLFHHFKRYLNYVVGEINIKIRKSFMTKNNNQKNSLWQYKHILNDIQQAYKYNYLTCDHILQLYDCLCFVHNMREMKYEEVVDLFGYHSKIIIKELDNIVIKELNELISS